MNYENRISGPCEPVGTRQPYGSLVLEQLTSATFRVEETIVSLQSKCEPIISQETNICSNEKVPKPAYPPYFGELHNLYIRLLEASERLESITRRIEF